MEIQVKKIWFGSVSVRDYVVKECFERGENLVIRHQGRVMTIPHSELKSGRRNKMKNVSRFKDQVYDLIDFPWRPTENDLSDLRTQ